MPDGPGPERTAQEREAARLERARRRAARDPGTAGRGAAAAGREPGAGRAPVTPAPVQPDREAVTSPSLRVVPTAGRGEESGPEADHGSGAVVGEGSGPEAGQGSGPEAGQGSGPEAGSGSGPQAGGAASRPPMKSFPSPPPVHEDDENDRGANAYGRGYAELPSGTRRISRLEGKRGRRSRPPARRPAAPRRRADTSRRRSWAGRIVSLLALILAGAAIWFLVELFQPFGTSPHGRVTVVVPARSGAHQVGDLLAHDGVVSSGFFFELRATLSGQRGHLRAGTYHLQLGMSYGAVLTALTKVPKAAPTTQLTISEGHTRQYVSALLRSQKIRGNYLAATRSSKLLDPHAYGAPRSVPSLEGFLFPDTFMLVKPVSISTLVDDQLRDFKRRFAGVTMGYAHSKHLTPYDVLKIASLIEAEAASATARPLVASVIYNRLADHMMLQLDSTARYATGNFTRPLKVSQLESPSPYNTHTHFGLPPTPIDSPGLAAIEAAAHPGRSRYLYFFSKPCSNQTVFASSYSQFLHLLKVDRRNHC